MSWIKLRRWRGALFCSTVGVRGGLSWGQRHPHCYWWHLPFSSPMWGARSVSASLCSICWSNVVSILEGKLSGVPVFRFDPWTQIHLSCADWSYAVQPHARCWQGLALVLHVSGLSKCSLEKGMCSWSNTQNIDVDKLDWELTSQEAEGHYSTPPVDHTLGSERGKWERERELWKCSAGHGAFNWRPRGW